MPGIDEYDFQARVDRLETEGCGRREMHRQKQRMRKHGYRDGRRQEAVL
jgi:hypothetical protein